MAPFPKPEATLRTCYLFLSFLIFASCNEYGINAKVGGTAPADDTADIPRSVTGDADGSPDEEDDDDDDDGDTDPPEWIEDCTEGTTVRLSPEELFVFSWDSTTSTGTLEAEEAGWYHLYDLDWAESGDSQRNESAFVRITNGTTSLGYPRIANCEDDWIIRDADNEPTAPAMLQYGGTFWLDAGPNEVSLIHNCPRVRAGSCAVFHDTSTEESTCDSLNVNSVHMVGEAFCVVRDEAP